MTGTPLKRQEWQLKRRLRNTLDRHKDLKIGIYGGTAAANAVVNALHDATAFLKQIECDKASTPALREWIANDLPNIERIVFCDHGIARDIVSSQQRLNSSMSLFTARAPDLDNSVFSFAFPRRLPVGFAAPRHDIEWYGDVYANVQNAFRRHWKVLAWDSVVEEMKEIGMNAYSLEVMCKSLQLEDLYRKTILPHHREMAAQSGDSEAEARILRKLAEDT